MDRNLLGGVKLHPLVRLAIDTAAFSHDESLWVSQLMKSVKSAPFVVMEEVDGAAVK